MVKLKASINQINKWSEQSGNIGIIARNILVDLEEINDLEESINEQIEELKENL